MARNISKTVKTVTVTGFAIDVDTMTVAPVVSFDVVGGITERKALKLAKGYSASVVTVKLSESEKRYRMSVDDFVKYATPISDDENDDEEDDENI